MTQEASPKCWSANTLYSKLDDDTSAAVVVELSPLKKNEHDKTNDDSHVGTIDEILISSVEIPWYRKNIGVIYIIISVLCINCLNITIKMVSKSDERLPVLQLVFIRGCFGSLVIIIMMLQQNVQHWFGSPEIVRLLLARGFSGFMALTFSFFAVSFLSMGDATILSFFAPVFAGLLGSIFLKETWHTVDNLQGSFA
jgi:hypothetical protein